MALRTMPPRKASSSACHQTRPVSTGSAAARVGADLESAFGAVRAAQRQHAVEGRGRGGLRIGLFQYDFEAVGAAARARLGGMVDQRTVVRKKRPGRIAQPGEGGLPEPAGGNHLRRKQSGFRTPRGVAAAGGPRRRAPPRRDRGQPARRRRAGSATAWRRRVCRSRRRRARTPLPKGRRCRLQRLPSPR